MMKSLLLVRHAHTEMAGRFCGHSDPDLSSAGRSQLAEIVVRLRQWPVSKVYASDLKRTIQTAQAIASSLDNLSIQVRPGLREIHFGDWEGCTWEEIEANDPTTASAWLKDYPSYTAPGGEAFHDFQQRVREELSVLAGITNDECVAAVTHAGFIRTAISLVAEAPIVSIPQVDYGSVTELQLVQQTWIVAGQ
jgi:alpha-ribazole phosphatase